MALSAASRMPTSISARHGTALRVMVVGLRGVVGVQGGIETHSRMLYPLLARLGCAVEIVQRSRYYPRARRRRSWRGLTLTYLWSPALPRLETAVHSLLGVLYAAFRRPDILHLHAVGPGSLAPLARLFGLRVVVTYHSADHEREAFGPLARMILKAGERWGLRLAHRRIAVSPVLQRDLERRHGIGAAVIANGAPLVTRATTCRAVDAFGLKPRRYVLSVGRLDAAKRQADLIDAFRQAAVPGWKLAIVGGLVAGDRYCEELRRLAARDSNVVLTDFQTGAPLRELYTHAGLFVLPSSVEGHPIALLEALCYGLPVLASDIPANRTLPLPRERYFSVGDKRTLARLLSSAAAGPDECGDGESEYLRTLVRERYSWREAARMTRSVYEDARGRHG
jgi:glycosyltransferase involved in cell wall biosynthesis